MTVPQPPEDCDWLNLCSHLSTKEVDAQLSSPLYNGRIPAEIRNLIFEFAVTEFPSPKARTLKSDACVQNSHDLMPVPGDPSQPPVENVVERARGEILGIVHPRQRMSPYTRSHTREPQDGFDWLRFDNTEPMKVAYALLLTCRRAYLEAHSLPLLQTEQRFYCYRGPFSSTPKGSRSDIGRFITGRLSNPSPRPGLQQRDLVRSVRVFAQQFWLEDEFLGLMDAGIWFPNLEHLRITMRRSDWWDWERNATLRINPYIGHKDDRPNPDYARRGVEIEAGNIEFTEGAWGKVFSYMSKLKTLTIDFETSEDKRGEMEAIISWAVKWRFPLPDGRHLSTGGQAPSKTSWRGLPHHWSDRCVACGHHVRNGLPREECNKCKETRRLVSQRYGPQLFIWTCTWKPE